MELQKSIDYDRNNEKSIKTSTLYLLAHIDLDD
jgi:hypothetical protein